jgi:hypothetical protein
VLGHGFCVLEASEAARGCHHPHLSVLFLLLQLSTLAQLAASAVMDAHLHEPPGWVGACKILHSKVSVSFCSCLFPDRFGSTGFVTQTG